MSTDFLWERVERLVASAHDRVILIAPFIKMDVAVRVVSSTGSGVRLECYTRWDPDEVARGVSDPDIVRIPELAGKVHLCPNLHAKLVLADERALVGSANLTSKALGLAEKANVEIMVEVPADMAEVLDLLEVVRAGCDSLVGPRCDGLIWPRVRLAGVLTV